MTALLFVLFSVDTFKRKHTGVDNCVHSTSNGPLSLIGVQIGGALGKAVDGRGNRCSLSITANSSIALVCSYLNCGGTREVLPRMAGSVHLGIRVGCASLRLKRIMTATVQGRAAALRALGTSHIGLLPSPTKKDVRDLIIAFTNIASGGRLDSRCSMHNNDCSRGVMCIGKLRIFHPLLVHSKRRRKLDFVGPSVARTIGFSTKKFRTHCKSGVDSILSVACGGPGKFRNSTSTDLLKTGTCINDSSNGFARIANFHCGAKQSLLGAASASTRCSPGFVSLRACVACRLTPG